MADSASQLENISFPFFLNLKMVSDATHSHCPKLPGIINMRPYPPVALQCNQRFSDLPQIVDVYTKHQCFDCGEIWTISWNIKVSHDTMSHPKFRQGSKDWDSLDWYEEIENEHPLP